MRRLVVLADGTWRSEADPSDITNVERLRNALPAAGPDGVEQARLYVGGVGVRRLERLTGGAFGVGLSRNVRECYRWLVEEYEEGDALFLVGFSRGAYTVRSLAGLVRNAGLLRPEHLDKADEAYSRYRSRRQTWHPDGASAEEFRRRWSREITRIECIAVWDTVGALGVPTRGPLGWLTRRRYGFHDVELSGRVAHAYHALAIDERRRAFAPALWRADAADQHRQTVEQVWFAGDHSDVGGGNGDCPLSDISLRWVADRVAGCGLHLDQDGLPAPDAVAEVQHVPVNDSYRSIFRLQRPHVREFCSQPVVTKDGRTLVTSEDVHDSVLRRHRDCVDPPAGPYDPDNLRAHLRRVGSSAGT